MSKALICKGKNTAGEEILFEAHNNEDAALRAESYEVAEFSVEPNPDYKEPQMTDAEEEEAEKDIVTASDLAARDKTDKQVLAEANATLFNQLDALKNKCLDLQAVLTAWNTEQHSKAAAGNADATYVEPDWMELVRKLV